MRASTAVVQCGALLCMYNVEAMRNYNDDPKKTGVIKKGCHDCDREYMKEPLKHGRPASDPGTPQFGLTKS